MIEDYIVDALYEILQHERDNLPTDLGAMIISYAVLRAKHPYDESLEFV